MGLLSPVRRMPFFGITRPLERASLTLSGNEITDATRRAGVQGDGRTPPGGFGIWEATENVIKNGGAETNTSFTAAGSGATVTRVTTQQKFGAASFEVVTAAANASGIRFHPDAADRVLVTAGDVWRFSVWAKLASAGSKSMLLAINFYDAADSFVASEVPSVTVNSTSWTRYSASITVPALSHNMRFFDFTTNGDQGAFTYYVDGVQLEKQPIATPYVETDGAAASRTAARVRIAVLRTLDEATGWVAARLRMGFDSTANPVLDPSVFDWADTSWSDYILVQYQNGNGWRTVEKNSGTAEVNAAIVSTFSAGDLVTTAGRWGAGTIGISVDGSVFTNSARNTIPDISNTLAEIGNSTSDQTRFIDSDILWMAVGRGVLTDADAARLHRLPDVLSNYDQVRAAVGQRADLRAVWLARTGTFERRAA